MNKKWFLMAPVAALIAVVLLLGVTTTAAAGPETEVITPTVSFWADIEVQPDGTWSTIRDRSGHAHWDKADLELVLKQPLPDQLVSQSGMDWAAARNISDLTLMLDRQDLVAFVGDTPVGQGQVTDKGAELVARQIPLPEGYEGYRALVKELAKILHLQVRLHLPSQQLATVDETKRLPWSTKVMSTTNVVDIETTVNHDGGLLSAGGLAYTDYAAYIGAQPTLDMNQLYRFIPPETTGISVTVASNWANASLNGQSLVKAAWDLPKLESWGITSDPAVAPLMPHLRDAQVGATLSIDDIAHATPPTVVWNTPMVFSIPPDGAVRTRWGSLQVPSWAVDLAKRQTIVRGDGPAGEIRFSLDKKAMPYLAWSKGFPEAMSDAQAELPFNGPWAAGFMSTFKVTLGVVAEGETADLSAFGYQPQPNKPLGTIIMPITTTQNSVAILGQAFDLSFLNVDPTMATRSVQYLKMDPEGVKVGVLGEQIGVMADAVQRQNLLDALQSVLAANGLILPLDSARIGAFVHISTAADVTVPIVTTTQPMAQKVLN